MEFSEYCNVCVCHIRSMFTLTNIPKITSIFAVYYFTLFIFAFYVSFSSISISYIYIHRVADHKKYMCVFKW